MKLAVVSPLHERVPPVQYGGTERIVSYLCEELVTRGHDVTLFASGDSLTRAELVSCSSRALRTDSGVLDPLPHHFAMLEKVRRRAHEFDLIHFHTDYLHLPIARFLGCKHVSTLHGRLDIPDLVPLYETYPEIPVTSISFSQRRPLPHLKWTGNVYHGLPENLYRFHPRSDGYLAFLGRVSPEKGLVQAIAIAEQARLPLKIAAKIDKHDEEFFESTVRPLLDRSRYCEFIGEIGDAEKNGFLGGARALLFPIDWPEPFGIVMIEAMACGTPVIAFRAGSVPEVMVDGKTGFVVESKEEALDALRRLGEVSRRDCRSVFERRFTARRMARDYEAVYRRQFVDDYRGISGRHYPAEGPVLRTGDIIAG